MKSFSSLSCILLLSTQVFAGPIDRGQALQTAKDFLREKGITQVTEKEAGTETYKESGTRSGSSEQSAAYYVFDAGDNQGFVIVSGDDRTAPVLGYCEEGCFDKDYLPDNMRAWLEGYAKAINALDEYGYNVAYTRSASTNKAAIAPLIKTTWNQDAPYNLQCPKYENTNYPTGCVATAYAQIMYYWKFPAEMPACKSYSYQLEGNIKFVDAISAHTIYWNALKTSYNATDIDDNLAWLMRHCGQELHMQYDLSGSASHPYKLYETLMKVGYDKSIRTVFRDCYSIDAWENLIYKEIQENRPVIYTGDSNGGGHAFICDGYDGKGFFHINWGWGGYCDGYFNLSILDSQGQGIGGGKGAFSFGQDATIGISVGQYKSETLSPELSLSATYYELSNSTLNLNIFNHTGHKATFQLGLGYVDAQDNITPFQTTISEAELDMFYGYMGIQYKLKELKYPKDGTYRIIPISKVKTDTTYKRAWKDGLYIYVTVKNGNVTECTLSKQEANLEVTIDKIEGAKLSGFTHTATISLKNNGEECEEEAYIHIISPDNKKKAVDDSRSMVRLRKAESMQIKCEIPGEYFNNGGGKYIVHVETGSGKTLAEKEIELAASPEYVFSDVKITEITFEMGQQLTAVVLVKNDSKEPYPFPIEMYYYSGDITGNTASKTGTYVRYLETPIEAGTIAEIRFPIKEFYSDNLVYAQGFTYETPKKKTLYKFGETWKRVCAVSIDETGWRTYSSAEPLDFKNCPDIKAYTGKMKDSGDEIVLTEVNRVIMQNTGLVVNGIPNSVYAVEKTKASTLSSSVLVPVQEDSTVEANSVFVFNGSGENSSFVLNNATLLLAGTAYLPKDKVKDGITTVKVSFASPTDIEDIIPDAEPEHSDSNIIYNISGEKVSDNYRGFIIKNGKIELRK